MRAGADSAGNSAIVIFGFPGLGDLVRCHSLVQMIAEQYPHRPIDIVARRPAVEIAAFMPEVRQGIGEDFEHQQLSLLARRALAKDLRGRDYGTAYVMQSSLKAALVPFLARIPERIGWSREGRWPLLSAPRFGVRRLPRMVDEICTLGIRSGEDLPVSWPEPRLRVPAALKDRHDLFAEDAQKKAPLVAIAPGSGELERDWPVENYAAVAQHCVSVGCTVWIVGSIVHRHLAAAIAARAPVHDCMTDSLTELALRLAVVDVFVGNDSGPLHVAAAFNKPSIGIFGRFVFAPMAPINAVVKPITAELSKTRTWIKHVRWPSVERVLPTIDQAIASVRPGSGRTH